MKPNIFIIEKNNNLGQMLYDNCKSRGYQIYCSSTFTEVLKLIKYYKPSLFIIHAPELSSAESQKLKKYIHRKHIPVIYIGSWSETDINLFSGLNIINCFENSVDCYGILNAAEEYFEKQNKILLARPENNNKVFETDSSILWLDTENVLCCIIKPVKQSLSNTKKLYRIIRTISENKKFFILIDTTLIHPLDKQNRDYLMDEMPNYFLGVAVISNSIFGKITSSFFIATRKISIPVKLFPSERKAREWFLRYNF